MSEYRKILLIADPAMRRTAAFERAVALAKASGAELHISLFDHSNAVLATRAVRQELSALAKWAFIEQRERWLRQAAETLAAEGLRANTSMVWAKPLHEAIIEQVLTLSPDLVIKDVHHEPLLKRLLLAPLDWQLLRLCPAPLLLVNAAAHTLPKRIIAAVDTAHEGKGGVELNDLVIKAALQLAMQCNASLHLAHAFEELVPVMPTEFTTPLAFGDIYGQLLELHKAQFEAFANAHSVPPAQRHLLIGAAAGALAELTAQSLADVLVMATTFRTGLDRILIGSTAERILEDLRCDVLAIKPAGFMADLAKYLDLEALHQRAKAEAIQPLEGP